MNFPLQKDASNVEGVLMNMKPHESIKEIREEYNQCLHVECQLHNENIGKCRPAMQKSHLFILLQLTFTLQELSVELSLNCLTHPPSAAYMRQ